jgi:hypothetical protein
VDAVDPESDPGATSEDGERQERRRGAGQGPLDRPGDADRDDRHRNERVDEQRTAELVFVEAGAGRESDGACEQEHRAEDHGSGEQPHLCESY